MAALGDLLYRAASVWKRLVGNTTTTRKFLSQTGTGSASDAPSWDQVADSDLSTSNITTNNVTTAKHGFVPILPNDATKFFDGIGGYSTPPTTSILPLHITDADTVEQYNSTNRQRFSVYYTRTSSTNFGRLDLAAGSNGVWYLGTQIGSGGGVERTLRLSYSNATIGSSAGAIDISSSTDRLLVGEAFGNGGAANATGPVLRMLGDPATASNNNIVLGLDIQTTGAINGGNGSTLRSVAIQPRSLGGLGTGTGNAYELLYIDDGNCGVNAASNNYLVRARGANTDAFLVTRGGKVTGIGGYVGTTTNDNAAAGCIGEYVESVIASGSAVSLTTATATNITSISLTAGDWEVTGVVDFVLTGATSTDYKAGVSSTSATFGAQDSFVNQPLITTLLSDTLGVNLPAVRFSLASTTTVYLVAQATFSAGTTAGYGTIRARRVR